MAKSSHTKIWILVIALFLAGVVTGGSAVGIFWKRHIQQLVNLGDSFHGTALLFRSLVRDADLNEQEKKSVAPVFGQLMSQTLFIKMEVQPEIDRELIQRTRQMTDLLPPEKAEAVEEFLWILIRRGRPAPFRLLIEAVEPSLEELVMIDEVLSKNMMALLPDGKNSDDLAWTTLVEDVLRVSVDELSPQLPEAKRKRLKIFYANYLRGYPKRDQIAPRDDP